MELADVTALVSRWAHILAAIAAVGGTIFARFVLLPSQTVLAPEQREALHREMRARWSKIVAASIGLLLISGLYNFVLIVRTESLPRWYHPLFGVKFLIALVIFMIASLLSGRTIAAEKLRSNARFWMSLNIALAVIVVCLSGLLRSAHKLPKDQPLPAPAAPTRA